ncbi:MAG: FkbM family methyltransferase [Flavisolibacter sp.]
MQNSHLKSLSNFSLADRIKLVFGLLAKKAVRPGLEKLLRTETLLSNIYRSGGTAKDNGETIELSYKPSFSSSFIRFVIRKKSTDPVIFHEILMGKGGDYYLVPEIVNMVGLKVKTIVDAGANIGCATAYFKTQFSDARIISIEPAEENFRILQQNLSLNGFDDVKPMQNAFWINNDELNFGVGLRGTREKELSFGVSATETETKVKGLTFKDCLKLLGTDTIDILKIDIEGAEKTLIEDREGFAYLLDHTRILAIELHNEVVSTLEFIDLVERAGFAQLQTGEILLCWKRQSSN